MSKAFHEINVSPFATNVLDLIDRAGLCTADGSKVKVWQAGTDFRIRVGDAKEVCINNNISASAYLNRFVVGFMG